MVAPSRAPSKNLVLAAAITFGAALGIGSFTFRYAKGFSYFSADPKACVNCHIMSREYDGWQKSSHHIAAVCIDCHLPHAFVPKYFAKAENGWRHSKEFTLQTFAEPIRLKPASAKILQDNRIRCHKDLVHDVAQGVGTKVSSIECVHCHDSVGHGARAALGGPMREFERTSPEGKAPR